MKTVSDALGEHLCSDTTLAELVKITRADGVVKAFTTFDRDLTVDGVVYVADGSLSTEQLPSSSALKSKDFTVVGIIDSECISEADLKNGAYDHALIDVYVCNWADVSQGSLLLRHGWMGEILYMEGKYVAQLRGLCDNLKRRVGDVFTPECRFDLGDGKCSVDVEAMAVSGYVTSVTDNAVFEDYNCAQVDAYFDYGKIVWSSGANQGLSMEVKSWSGDYKQFTLWLPMPNAVEINDAYKVYPGCDKRFSVCCSKFNNAANFGGFPHLPGLAKILQYPDSH
ncbi:MAG: DUF2163 domain-containing protein [Alphaproteobacteria bacterium]|nr:DUF2163 domain-containing protein [Alphaproteobacteria bacterium]